MHEDDDVTELPVAELRRRVYAQGADEADERWIRAAAELDRRERATRPAQPGAGTTARAGADGGASAAADAPASDGSPSPDGAEAGPDPALADADADDAAPRRASRRALAGAAVAVLAVGLLAGGAIGASVGSPAPATPAAESTPTRAAAAPPAAAGSSGATPTADAPALLGPDSTSDQRSRPVGAVFGGPQEDVDRPPKAVRADVDPTSIRAVQTSVGLYAGLSTTGDLCLLVFPSGGAGVVTCASPDRVASDGLRIAWTTEFPSRNRDGSTGMITGDVEATWSGDDLITLTTPNRILAY